MRREWLTWKVRAVGPSRRKAAVKERPVRKVSPRMVASDQELKGGQTVKSSRASPENPKVSESNLGMKGDQEEGCGPGENEMSYGGLEVWLGRDG